MSRILVRKSDILKFGDKDNEAMRSFSGSEKEDANKPKAGDDFSAYKDYYGNYPDAKAAFDTDLFSAQRNPKSTAVPRPEPVFEPGELTREELIEQAREQQEKERQAARAEKLAGMKEQEKMKFLGEELAERTDESAKQKVKDQLMNQALTGGKTFDPETGKEIPLEKLIQQSGLSEADRKEIMAQADVSFDDITRPAPTEAEAQPSAPMQPDAESVAIPPGFKHGIGARARKVLTEDGRLKRIIVENEEGGVQDAGLSHNMILQDPSGTSPYFRSRKGPRDTIPMSKFLHRFMSREPQRAAQMFGYPHMADRKTTTQDNRDERMQMQIAMALHSMREDPDVLANLINAQGLVVTDKSVPTTPEEALAQVKRNFPQITVPSQQEQLAVEMMREHFPDAIPEGNPTLAAAFGEIDRIGSTDTMSAEDLQELTVGQGEKVDVPPPIQRKPDSETRMDRDEQRILNTFGADKARANPDEFERFKKIFFDRMDAIDFADDRARRTTRGDDEADEKFGTPMHAFGFGTERTDDPLEDALQSAMMIHQRAEAERPDEFGIVQSDMQRQIEEAMQARAGAEGGANIDETRDMLNHLDNEIDTQKELLAEQGEATAKLRQRGRKNAVAENIQHHINQLIMLRNNARLSLQRLTEGRSGARRATGTPAPTPELARLARDFQQGNVVDEQSVEALTRMYQFRAFQVRLVEQSCQSRKSRVQKHEPLTAHSTESEQSSLMHRYNASTKEVDGVMKSLKQILLLSTLLKAKMHHLRQSQKPTKKGLQDSSTKQ